MIETAIAGDPPNLADIDPALAARIERIVEDAVGALTTLDIHSVAYGRRVAEIDAIGSREITATSELARRMLERPQAAIRATLDARSPLARQLAALRRAVDEIDPSRYDFTPGRPHRVLGGIAPRDGVGDYLDRYEQAQARIGRVVAALGTRRAGLELDSAAMEQDERSLWTEMRTLRQYAVMAHRLDEVLDRRIAELAATDPGRAEGLRLDVLYSVRRRHQEILMQLAISTQAYEALSIVRRNNDELVLAIDAAVTSTATAMRSAALVAGALTAQRLAAGQVRSASSAASGGAIADVRALRDAWNEVSVTLDRLDGFRQIARQQLLATTQQPGLGAAMSGAVVSPSAGQGGAPALVPEGNDRTDG